MFAYFDENRCRWEVETDSCDDNVNDSENESGTDTNVVGDDSSGDQNLQCETLDETWMCSSGPKNHSRCIKFCAEGLDFLLI